MRDLPGACVWRLLASCGPRSDLITIVACCFYATECTRVHKATESVRLKLHQTGYPGPEWPPPPARLALRRLSYGPDGPLMCRGYLMPVLAVRVTRTGAMIVLLVRPGSDARVWTGERPGQIRSLAQ
jgi:hypothetical protein